MKILHTSDWHLGKKLYRYNRIEEQREFLKWLLCEIEDRSIDILIIAGDIFDVPSPSNEAHKLYNDFLSSCSQVCHSIIIISGNHDSGDFLKATESFTHEKNIYVYDKIHEKKEHNYLQITKDNQTIELALLPYFRNIDLYNYHSHEIGGDKENPNWRIEAIEHLLDCSSKHVKFVVSHHAFGNYSATGSEHTLSLSGIEQLSLKLFKNFDYAALGHIHQYQKLSESPYTYYTGSPLPMRFSESKNKAYNLIEVEKNEIKEIKKISIPTFRELVQIKTNSKTYIEDIREQLKDINSPLTPYIEVKIRMEESLSGMAQTIKGLCEEYKCELLNIIPILAFQENDEESIVEIDKLSPLELLQIYYQEKYPEKELNTQLKNKFNELLSEIKNEDS